MEAIAKALAQAQQIARFPEYRFTASGRVISLIGKRPRYLKPIQMGAYVGLQLRNSDGVIVREYLHRLICEAFRGQCPDGYQCRHLDGDKSNNKADNLDWGTASQNNLDKRKHGTNPGGERNPMAKLTQDAVAQMRKVRAERGMSYARIANLFGVSTMTAFRAVTGQSWRME